jgi:hypothetical protein
MHLLLLLLLRMLALQAPPMAPLPPVPPTGCSPSALGYVCSQALGEIVLHWSVGGSAAPENICTGTRPLLDGAGQPPAARQDGTPPLLVHFAVEAATRGYVSLGFPESPARMFNADMVLGYEREDSSPGPGARADA